MPFLYLEVLLRKTSLLLVTAASMPPKTRGLFMKEIKVCSDCLHCKVSMKSTKDLRFCFCAKKKEKENRLEVYWVTKPVCRKFEDMTA
jgi:hypothetical protein